MLNIDLKVAQKLTQTITTDTIQSLEILQYKNSELVELIAEKATENPLLTIVEHNTNYSFTA